VPATEPLALAPSESIVLPAFEEAPLEAPIPRDSTPERRFDTEGPAVDFDLATFEGVVVPEAGLEGGAED